MIRTLILLPVFVFLVGCNSAVQKDEKKQRFAGVWETAQGKQGEHWKLVFEGDGNISEVVRPDGVRMVLSEGGMKQEPEPNIFVHFLYGPAIWSYDSQLDVLQATVVIDEYYIKAGDAELTCAVIDQFEGLLSEDGQQWAANWITTTKWLDTTSEPAPDQVSDVQKIVFYKKDQ